MVDDGCGKKTFLPAPQCDCAEFHRSGTYLWTDPRYNVGPMGNLALLMITYDMFVEGSTGILEIISGAVETKPKDQLKVAQAVLNFLNIIRIKATTQVDPKDRNLNGDNFPLYVPVADVARHFNAWAEGAPHYSFRERKMFKLHGCASSAARGEPVFMVRRYDERKTFTVGTHVNFAVKLKKWGSLRAALFNTYFASTSKTPFQTAQEYIRTQVQRDYEHIDGEVVGFLLNAVSLLTSRWFFALKKPGGGKGEIVNRKNAWAQMFKTPLTTQFRSLGETARATLASFDLKNYTCSSATFLSNILPRIHIAKKKEKCDTMTDDVFLNLSTWFEQDQHSMALLFPGSKTIDDKFTIGNDPAIVIESRYGCGKVRAMWTFQKMECTNPPLFNINIEAFLRAIEVVNEINGFVSTPEYRGAQEDAKRRHQQAVQVIRADLVRGEVLCNPASPWALLQHQGAAKHIRRVHSRMLPEYLSRKLMLQGSYGDKCNVTSPICDVHPQIKNNCTNP